MWILSSIVWGQQTTLDWKEQVREYAEQQNWTAALQIVEREISQSPQDADIRSWRPRVLLWSGRLADAEREYLEILAVSPNDPDYWMGLASVYSREGRVEEAKKLLDHAVSLDPKRADVHLARGRALQSTDNLGGAKAEFQKTLDLDPENQEARTSLRSLRGDPKHELRLGTNTDVFSFAGPNFEQEVSFASQWTPRWRTTATGSFYRWAGVDAEKLAASATAKSPRWGALEVGGATANDNAVIPQKEAFLGYDQGWRFGGSNWVRGLEVVCGQHWYWYSTARILTINEMAIFYLPSDWTWSLGLIEARSHFFGSETEWRPSGITRVGFPIARHHEQRLEGNIFFAAGTENFAQVDQLGHFSSHTYGGGLRFQLTTRQNVTGVAAFQQRTQDQSEISFGFMYGIRF